MADWVEKMLFTLMSYVGMVRFGSDTEKAVTGRSKLIWEEAVRRGVPMEQVVIWGKPIEMYRAKINGEWTFFQSLPIPQSLHQSGYRWLDDKFILAEKLEQVGIAVPKSRRVLTISDALKGYKDLSKPIIVKPQNGSRGRHTTTNIHTKEELKKAVLLGREITLWMVMQEHLFGSVYRATVINNKLVGFFRADAPEVVGDGVHTVRELIELKNKSHHERLSDITINDDLITFIKRSGYTLDSIIPSGVKVHLSAKTGRMYGGYTEEMLPKVHPKMHEIFKKAGEVVQAPVVGFDLIIENPLKDPDTQRWGIIECNSLPFIDLHYMALEGEPINLAKNVWDLWEVKY